MSSQVFYKLDQVGTMIHCVLDIFELAIIYFLRISLAISLLVAVFLYTDSTEIYHNNIGLTLWSMLHYGIFVVVTDFYHAGDASWGERLCFVGMFSAPLLPIIKYDATMTISLLLC